MNTKRVAIINVDEPKYVIFSDGLKLALESVKINVDIVDKFFEVANEYSSFIFITRWMRDEARALKKTVPEKIVILFTGSVELGDDEDGVIPIEKGGRWALKKIIELVQ